MPARHRHPCQRAVQSVAQSLQPPHAGSRRAHTGNAIFLLAVFLQNQTSATLDIQRRRTERAAIRSRSPPQQTVARPHAGGCLPGVKAACTFERPSENLISADYQSAVFRCFQKQRRYVAMKFGRIRQDGRDGFADFCLEDGRGRLKVKQAFRRPLFYRLRRTKANSGLRLFQADGEQAA